jgi:hypothetical protein
MAMPNEHENSFFLLMEKKTKRMLAKKPFKMKDISREGKHHFECEAFVFLKQHNNAEKYYIFERLRRVKIEGKKANPGIMENDLEYRLSYYIVGNIGTKNGK